MALKTRPLIGFIKQFRPLLINYGRFLKINPENALERTNKKFIKRFQYLENQAKLKQRTLSSMTLAEMDVLWEEAKSQQSNE